MGLMRVAELAQQATKQFVYIEGQFSRVENQFTRVQEQFERVWERFAQVDEQFERVWERFDEMEAKMDRGFTELRNLVLGLYDILDSHSKRVDDVSQESTMLGSQVSRHDRWIHTLAKHNKLKLDS